MTKQETSLAKKPVTALKLPTELQGSWGSEGLDNADILIPKVLLMQAMSDLVAQEKAVTGDFVKSTTKEILGGKLKPFEFIPILSFKTWVIEEKVGEKFEFRGVEQASAETDDAMEWQENGKTFRRNRCLNFYALLPQDIERERKAMQSSDIPDPDDALLPILISFQRTGYFAGKELITHFAKAAHFGVPPAVSTFRMNSFMEKNDKGTYYVPMIEKAGKTSEENLAACRKWYDILKKARVKIDEVTEEKVTV